MGPQKKQVELLENSANVLDISQKKIRWLHSLILLEGSKNKLKMFMFSFLGGAVCQTAPSKYQYKTKLINKKYLIDIIY